MATGSPVLPLMLLALAGLGLIVVFKLLRRRRGRFLLAFGLVACFGAVAFLFLARVSGRRQPGAYVLTGYPSAPGSPGVVRIDDVPPGRPMPLGRDAARQVRNWARDFSRRMSGRYTTRWEPTGDWPAEPERLLITSREVHADNDADGLTVWVDSDGYTWPETQLEEDLLRQAALDLREEIRDDMDDAPQVVRDYFDRATAHIDDFAALLHDHGILKVHVPPEARVRGGPAKVTVSMTDDGPQKALDLVVEHVREEHGESIRRFGGLGGSVLVLGILLYLAYLFLDTGTRGQLTGALRLLIGISFVGICAALWYFVR
jgi:hypothetical protein